MSTAVAIGIAIVIAMPIIVNVGGCYYQYNTINPSLQFYCNGIATHSRPLSSIVIDLGDVWRQSSNTIAVE